MFQDLPGVCPGLLESWSFNTLAFQVVRLGGLLSAQQLNGMPGGLSPLLWHWSQDDQSCSIFWISGLPSLELKEARGADDISVSHFKDRTPCYLLVFVEHFNLRLGVLESWARLLSSVNTKTC